MAGISKDTAYNLNNPFSLYPSGLASPYSYIETYISEVNRLNDYITSFDHTREKQLFHLTVGAAMEEYLVSNLDEAKSKNVTYQWRQLFPFWLDKYIQTNKDANVTLVIVSPNISFYQEECKADPIFIEKTNDIYNWITGGSGMEYTSKNYNVTVKLFYTLFPHKCEYNEKYMKRMKLDINKSSKELFMRILQTNEDKLFIKRFYENIHCLFQKIISNKGFISCYSYAVFNIHTRNAAFGYKFKMFRELLYTLKRFPKKNIHVCEWMFSYGCYVVTDLINKSHVDDYFSISYIKPRKGLSDGHIPVIDHTNDITMKYDECIKYVPKNKKSVNKSKRKFDGLNMYECKNDCDEFKEKTIFKQIECADKFRETVIKTILSNKKLINLVQKEEMKYLIMSMNCIDKKEFQMEHIPQWLYMGDHESIYMAISYLLQEKIVIINDNYSEIFNNTDKENVAERVFVKTQNGFMSFI
jgi:hypothetical protein